METPSEKLLRIHQLWIELERMKPNTSESEALMEKIRVLPAEYQALIDTPQKRKASRSALARIRKAFAAPQCVSMLAAFYALAGRLMKCITSKTTPTTRAT